MSLRNITIIVLIILILGGVGWFIISQKTGPQGSDEERVGGGNLITNLFPFLGGDAESGDRGGDTSDLSSSGGTSSLLGGESSDSGAGVTLEIPKQLTTVPVAGFIATTTVSGPTVRYIERSTGNVYDIGKSGEAVRITNTTIPEIYDAVWNKEGTTVVLRYLNSNDVIKTYVARVVESQKTATSTGGGIATLDGTFLSDDISYLVANQDRSELLYLTQNQTGVSAFASPFDLKNPRRLFDSGFSEWTVELPRNNTLIATTKPSYLAPGFVYAVDQKTGMFLKLFGDVPGLTTSVNPEGDVILYSVSEKNNFTTRVYYTKDSFSTQLSLNTLPEKCTWNQKNVHIAYCGVPTAISESMDYPDAWYQGLVSFSDDIWEIDTAQNNVRIITSLSQYAGAGVDIIKPSVNEAGDTLYFIDKKEGTLWSVPLPKPIEVKTGTSTPPS